MRRNELPVVLTLLALIGCGGPPGGIAHGGSVAQHPPAITDDNVHAIERTFWRMAQDDPARLAWRDALIAYRSARSSEVLARGDYDEVVQHLAELSELLSPEDIGAGHVPADVAPMARWVVEHGARRGDEGRVMGALLLLTAIGESPDANRAERERIEEWGHEARARIDNPIERYGDLIQVWEQHEEIAPSPEVLATLAHLYVEQRDALMAAFGPEGQGTRTAGRLSRRELSLAPMLVERAPLDVAAVYLRHGDLEHAIEHVQRMDDQSGLEREIVQILQLAQQNDETGAHALDELARGFARARPDIAAAICRLGARRFPQDARFPLCLARVAIQESEPGRATSWYAEAIRLAPDEREIYDEALGRLGQLLAEGLLESNAREGRAVAHDALAILDERSRRWPDAAPAVSRDVLLITIARAEMNQGNVQEAREQLQASLEARETRDAHEQLGILLERVGEPRDAATHYRRALDMTEERGAEGSAKRAEILEHLGDAFRASGEERQSSRMYRQALSLWDELVRQVEGARTAIVHVRRGILLSRLGEAHRAEEAFDAAIDAAPSWREPYAAILSHLVVSAPNLELAESVLRHAQSHLTLEPQWKVYFALWVQTIARRASAQAESDVASVLADGSHGDSWSARLAAFGAGQLETADLIAQAHGRAQEAEAHFYAGARLLGAGDVAGARQQFEEVLHTGMVGFYEYAMAQELLSGMSSATTPEVASRPHAEAAQR
jgi:tetratricopeptide (TPR) repeat protein